MNGWCSGETVFVSSSYAKSGQSTTQSKSYSSLLMRLNSFANCVLSAPKPKLTSLLLLLAAKQMTVLSVTSKIVLSFSIISQSLEIADYAVLDDTHRHR